MNSTRNLFKKSIAILWRDYFPKISIAHSKQTDQNEAFSVLANNKVILKVSKDFNKRIENEISEWLDFLNWGFGLACFLFAQGVQGTPNPPLNAFFSLVWMFLLFMHQRKNKFPKLLTKDTTTFHILCDDKQKEKFTKIVIKKLKNKYISPSRVLRRSLFFIIGYLYLVFIALLALGPVQNFKILGTKLSSLFLPESCACIIKEPPKTIHVDKNSATSTSQEHVIENTHRLGPE